MNTSPLPQRLPPARRKDSFEALSDEERRQAFRLDPRIEEVLRYAKDPVNRVALFYHAVYLETFCKAPPGASIPGSVARQIAGVLDVTVPNPLPYPDTRSTFFHHAEKVRRILGWRIWTADVRQDLEHRLVAEARRSDDPEYLRSVVDGWFWEERILNPGSTRVKKMVAQARTQSREWIARTIASALTTAQLEKIDTLRHRRVGTHRSALQWLKDPIGKASPKTLADVLARIEFIRELQLPSHPFEKLHPDMRRRLRETVEVYPADNLWNDFPAERRQAIVACYLHERLRALVDFAVEIFDGIVLGMDRRSEADLARDMQDRAPSINEKVRMFVTMGKIMTDEAHVPDPAVRPQTYQAIPRDVLVRAIAEAEGLLRPPDYNHFDYLKSRYSFLRSFFPAFLRVIEFEAVKPAEPILHAIGALRHWNAEGVRKVPASAPIGFAPEGWRSYVIGGDGKIDRHYYEICAMLELHRGLQAAEIWAVGGRRYGNLEDLLIPPTTWEQVRAECIAELGLPKDAKAWLAQVLPTLTDQIATTTKTLPTNPQIFVAGDRVHLKAIEALPESEPVRILRERVSDHWSRTQIRIQDLLVDVDGVIGFSHVFRTLRGREGAPGGLDRGLLAALIAKGCNIGMGKMAVLSPGLTAGALRRADEMYLYEDTLRHAYETLVRAQRGLPIARGLGDERISMSDGMRVASRVATLRGALQPQAFAPGERVLTFYWHVSHLGPGYAAQVIGHDRDAAYVLDQIFHIQSELPILLHFTDTHGATETTFALAYLSQVEFCPRIKCIHEQDLHSPPGVAVEGPFRSHFAGPVDVELIEKHWDDVLRVLASIRRGFTSAVLLTQRLSSYARQNPLYRALREIGRVFKSRYILRYYNDPFLRRKVNTGLNRMEFFNALARYLFFARRGENWERDFEQQLHRASALLVLANACVFWNAVQISKVFKQLRAEGAGVREDDLQHISPYAFEHIIPYGEYHFDLRRKSLEGAYLDARELEL